MSAQTFQPIAPRPAPVRTEGFVAWVRLNLFRDVPTSLMTIIVVAALLATIPPLLGWALFRASWLPNFDACRVDGVGACWGVVSEKYRLILFGRYPFAEQWRPLLACGMLITLLAASSRSEGSITASSCTLVSRSMTLENAFMQRIEQNTQRSAVRHNSLRLRAGLK